MPENGDDLGNASPVLHELHNHLAIIVSFCDLLLAETPPSDRRHADVQEIRSAGLAALALEPEIERRMRSST